MGESFHDSSTTGAGRERRRRGVWLAAGAVGVVAVLTLLAVSFGPAAAQAHRFFGHGGGHGWLGRGGSQEVDEERLRMGAEWVLGRVDASEEQIDAVVTIAAGAIDELSGLKQAHRERRQAFVEALSGEEVDRPALEELRAAELLAVDAASERLVAALAELAEVLTPAQRSELLELHDRFHAH